ncbi:hypothetical protein BP00DRAFT_442378 [Aspergillus indologenus CBS 114.80]|uniref:Nephrocystin 3-like N-terminal domain-containing protein n=1 Tax=Aspergillus indologenus CBS 114.80 TaxID=1450541 RepID=A0A2V5IIN4_9EURO|nr:hypothetical protein BP00DRAFT_442378 [Aspergillus indologenus CBS 114.80]
MPGRSWLAGDPYYRWEDELLPRPECTTCQDEGVPDGSCQRCVQRTALETFEEMLVETHNDLCQRIADNQATFNAWLDSDDIGFFYITGGPGSGKSFLMYSLHNEDNEERLRAGWFRGTYGSWVRLFFYPFTEKPRELNFLTMIRGLLFALIKEYPKLAQALFPRVASQATTPGATMIHDHEVLDAWDELVAAGLPYDEDKIFLTIDGLNKLDPADHPRMIRALKDWVQARPHNVKICISSRGEKAFQEAFESYPGYNIDGVNLVDMLWYARDEPLLEKAFPRINKLVSPDEPYKLEYSMAKMADGSMLYLLKLVRSLIREESRSCGSIEEIIDDLTKRMLRYRGNYDSDMLNSPQLEY